MTQKRAYRSGVLVVTFGFLLQQAISFVTGIVVGRTIGASEFGVFAVLRNLVAFLLTLAPLGLDLALLKHTPRYDQRPEDFRRQILRLRLLVAAVNLAILGFVLLGGGRWLQTHVYHFPNFSRLLFIAFIGLPFAADLAVLGAVYRADNRPGTYALMTNYVQPFIRLGGAVLLLRLGWSTEGVVVANTAAYVVSSILVAIRLRSGRLAAQQEHPLEPDVWGGTITILRDSLWMAVSLFIAGAMRSVAKVRALAAQPRSSSLSRESMLNASSSRLTVILLPSIRC